MNAIALSREDGVNKVYGKDQQRLEMARSVLTSWEERQSRMGMMAKPTGFGAPRVAWIAALARVVMPVSEIFKTLDHVVDRLCDTICRLTNDIVRSITARQWIIDAFLD